jgi:hypothetical protein
MKQPFSALWTTQRRDHAPHDQQGGLVWHRLEQGVHQHEVDHGGLVDDHGSQSSGLSEPRRNPPAFGSTASSRWIVRASMPVASLMRLAARPVGAHRRIRTPLAARKRRIELTIVVLPTPGPPVMTSALAVRVSRTAAVWLSARVRPVLAQPGQGLVWVDPGPRQGALGEGEQAICHGAFGTMQAGEKDAGGFADPVGDRRFFLPLQVERGLDQPQWDFEQLLGRFAWRQAGTPLVHGFVQRIGNRISRASRYGFSLMGWMARQTSFLA